jgi:uncharacterized membrane protein
MSERLLRIAGALLAVVGVAITVYLLHVRWSGGQLICSTGGCETVQGSSYAEVLGIPVAALGLAGYAALLVTALARGETVRLAHGTLALAALGFSAYLLVIQLVVIDAICQWCVASDVITTLITAVALLRLRIAATVPAAAVVPPPPRRAGPKRRAHGNRTGRPGERRSGTLRR